MIKVWESDLDLDGCMGILENMNLLECGHEKLVLTPILIDYVSVNIEDDSKNKLIHTISKYYMRLLSEFYAANSKVKDDPTADNTFFHIDEEPEILINQHSPS